MTVPKGSPDEPFWLPETMSRAEFAALGQRFSRSVLDFQRACAGTDDVHLRIATQLLDVVHDQVVAYLRAAIRAPDERSEIRDRDEP